MTRPNFSQLMNELRQEYLQGFPQRITRLNKFTEQLMWSELYAECHNIKGTGKTYGCTEFSELCWPMEILAENKATEALVHFPAAIAVIEEMSRAYQNDMTIPEKTLEKFNLIKNSLTDLAKPYAAKSMAKK